MTPSGMDLSRDRQGESAARPGRRPDGSAGDADYGRIGGTYADYRRPDPSIAAAIAAVLGDADSVLNVGAGAGSYEPTDRQVVAVEPSTAMRAQRPAHLTRAVDAAAEDLPFDDGTFDAAMTTFSVHQWRDLHTGMREIRRVARGPVVVLTCDPTLVRKFWLNEYAPAVLATEARRYPPVARLESALGGQCHVQLVPVSLDCTDGFNEAYYGRPEMLLDPGARQANSAWSFVEPALADAYVEHLRSDLESGTWDARYGLLRHQATFDGSLILLVAPPLSRRSR